MNRKILILILIAIGTIECANVCSGALPKNTVTDTQPNVCQASGSACATGYAPLISTGSDCNGCAEGYQNQTVNEQTYCYEVSYSLCQSGCTSCPEIFNKYYNDPLTAGQFYLGSAKYSTSELLRFDEGSRQACIEYAPFSMKYHQIKVEEQASFDSTRKIIRYYGICLSVTCNITDLSLTLKSTNYTTYRNRSIASEVSAYNTTVQKYGQFFSSRPELRALEQAIITGEVVKQLSKVDRDAGFTFFIILAVLLVAMGGFSIFFKSIDKRLFSKDESEAGDQVDGDDEETRLQKSLIPKSPFDCFSLKFNLRKFTKEKDIVAFQDPALVFIEADPNVNKDNLKVLHGIMGASILMIIMGNEYLTQLSIAYNREDLERITSEKFFYIVKTWYYGHDNFFFVQGFLAALCYVHRIENTTNGIFKSILIKILRFWPVLLAGLFFYWGISHQVLQGQFFGRLDTQSENCFKTWYYDFLFANNYGEPIQQTSCMSPWAWQFSVDMHCFVVEMFILILFKDNTSLGKLVAFVFALGTWISSVAVATNGEIVPLVEFDNTVTMYYWYYKTNTRASVHFLGFFLGLFYQAPGSLASYIKQMNNTKALGFQIFGLLGMFLVVLVENTNQGRTFQMFWLASVKLIYVFCVWLVCFPGLCGSNDIISKCLKHPIFIYLSKMFVSLYLVQASIVQIKNYRREYSIYMDGDSIFEGFCSSTLMVIGFGILFYLFIQLPVDNVVYMTFTDQYVGVKIDTIIRVGGVQETESQQEQQQPQFTDEEYVDNQPQIQAKTNSFVKSKREIEMSKKQSRQRSRNQFDEDEEDEGYQEEGVQRVYDNNNNYINNNNNYNYDDSDLPQYTENPFQNPRTKVRQQVDRDINYSDD